MKNHSPQPLHGHTPGFVWRPRWFLVNRFFAVIGVAGAVLTAEFVFRIETIRYPELWTLAGLLLLSNLAYGIWYRLSRLSKERDSSAIRTHLNAFTTVQINVDLVILTLMLHYSGGATNPFVFYYFFHTMLASILLSKRLAYLEAFVAALLFSGMTLLEGMGFIGHYNLIFPAVHQSPTFMLGMCAALSSALFIAVYMASSIMDRLRLQREALERALTETERLESEKSRFMNVVAHDLKSPLASIETMVSSALAVYGDRIPPKVREMMERIPVRTGELLKFIRELLDYSQIRSTDLLKVQFEPLDLLPVMREVVDIHVSLARNRNITLSFNAVKGVPMVMGNREYLKRAAANLISNAVRYTPENGSVTVTLSPVDKGAVLTVADTGIGIPAEDLSRIFTDFFRAGNARKFSPTGTGLGLSITRSIVEMHGGAITVSSTVGAGTTFTVRLPAYESVTGEYGGVHGNSGIIEG